MSLDGHWQVSAVSAGDVGLVWPQIEAAAVRALRQVGEDDLTPARIRARLEAGDFLLWVVHRAGAIRAFVVLNIVARPDGLVIMVVLIAGRDFEAWAPTVQRLLEDYGALIGAQRLESVSRVGMEKWMKALGWRRRAVIMEWRGKRDG